MALAGHVPAVRCRPYRYRKASATCVYIQTTTVTFFLFTASPAGHHPASSSSTAKDVAVLLKVGMGGVRVDVFGVSLVVERMGAGLWLEAGRTTVLIERVGYLPERGDRFFEREQCTARPGCRESGFYLRGLHVHVSREPHGYVGPMVALEGCPMGQGGAA